MALDRARIQHANDATYAAWNARDPEAVAAANSDRWRVRALHTGEFVGIPATGRRIDVQGCTFSTFADDGLVTRDVNCWDVRGLLEQMSPGA